MTRVCVHIVRHALALISLLADAGLSFAAAQMKLDATYKATLLGLPIGQMSWTVEIHDNRFESVAKGRSRVPAFFLDAGRGHGSRGFVRRKTSRLEFLT